MGSKIEEPDWLTDMDKEILEVLSTRLILTPSIISENIGRSRKGVSNRINSLQAGGLVQKVDRGKYRITEEGEEVWDQIDGKEYEHRRYEVTNRRLIRKEFGVSKEEYHKAVTEELDKIPSIKSADRSVIETAVEQAEEKLREANTDSDQEDES